MKKEVPELRYLHMQNFLRDEREGGLGEGAR